MIDDGSSPVHNIADKVKGTPSGGLDGTDEVRNRKDAIE
jgi:hypothetical protein